MRLSHLHGRKTCDRVRTKGKVWRGNMMVIRWLSEDSYSVQEALSPSAIFLGTYAPQTLHASAVKRNRMRRRCREAFRLVLREYTSPFPSVQVLVCPRSASLSAPFTDILADVRHFLSLLTR